MMGFDDLTGYTEMNFVKIPYSAKEPNSLK